METSPSVDVLGGLTIRVETWEKKEQCEILMLEEGYTAFSGDGSISVIKYSTNTVE